MSCVFVRTDVVFMVLVIVAIIVSDSTSVVVEVELMSCLFVMTDVVCTVFVMLIVKE